MAYENDSELLWSIRLLFQINLYFYLSNYFTIRNTVNQINFFENVVHKMLYIVYIYNVIKYVKNVKYSRIIFYKLQINN